MRWHRKRNLFIPALLLLCNTIAFAQTPVAPKILSSTDWKAYFSKNFNLKNANGIKTDITSSDIPYPAEWKYSADKDKKDMYMLFNVSPTADYVAMPSNNGVGTYLFSSTIKARIKI